MFYLRVLQAPGGERPRLLGPYGTVYCQTRSPSCYLGVDAFLFDHDGIENFSRSCYVPSIPMTT